MGAKLRVMLGVVLLALGIAGCAMVDPYDYGYGYLNNRAIYGPGGGIGGAD